VAAPLEGLREERLDDRVGRRTIEPATGQRHDVGVVVGAWSCAPSNVVGV